MHFYDEAWACTTKPMFICIIQPTVRCFSFDWEFAHITDMRKEEKYFLRIVRAVTIAMVMFKEKHIQLDSIPWVTCMSAVVVIKVVESYPPPIPLPLPELHSRLGITAATACSTATTTRGCSSKV